MPSHSTSHVTGHDAGRQHVSLTSLGTVLNHSTAIRHTYVTGHGARRQHGGDAGDERLEVLRRVNERNDRLTQTLKPQFRNHPFPASHRTARNLYFLICVAIFSPPERALVCRCSQFLAGTCPFPVRKTSCKTPVETTKANFMMSHAAEKSLLGEYVPLA